MRRDPLPDGTTGNRAAAGVASLLLVVVAGTVATLTTGSTETQDRPRSVQAAPAPSVVDDPLRTSAAAAGRAYALLFTQFDFMTFPQQIAALKAVSTPTFSTQLDQLNSALSATLTSTKGKSTSDVSHVAVETVTVTTADVLIFVDQSNTNSAVASPRVDQYRLVIRLQASSSATQGWLVDDIQVV